jgi:hypothetical protein
LNMARGRGRGAVPRYFPTHDPDGYPLPDARCSWFAAFVFFPIGLILIIVGSVIMSETNTTRRNWIAEYGPEYAPSSGNGFIGMIIVGAIFIALSCGCAFGCRRRNAQQYDEWALAHPDAARAFEARGGYEAVPLILLPTAQTQGQVQVIVVQSNPAGATGVPGGYGQPAVAAPILQNGTLVYPQQAQVPAGATNVVTVVGQQAANNGYFYKPEFRGQRLTPEQMAPVGAAELAAAMAQQQQTSTMVVQPGVVTGQPMTGGWAPTGNTHAAKPEEFSYAHSPPPAPAAAGIPGFGLQM